MVDVPGRRQSQEVMSAGGAPLVTSKIYELNAVLFKTQACRFFEQGCCTRKVCRFGHGEADLRPKPDLVKTAMCHFLTDRGHCRDRQCKFAHSRAELRPLARAIGDIGGSERRAGHLKRHVQAASPAPASGGLVDDYVSSELAPMRTPNCPASATWQLDPFVCTADELFVLFHATTLEQLIVAQPAYYAD
mmetsp:Transcript_11363/g.28640  ORF Transcript_11363/g.28640 Transcript_11363/m.28640 type:complete len:190 (+) Transcript_11363:33-602(+)